jgi:hypothetical protein
MIRIFQTIFALTRDSEFVAYGNPSMIRYRKFHEECRIWLDTGLANNDKVVHSLFKEWNDLFFPQGSDGDDSAPSAGLRRALQAVQGDADDDGSDDNDDNPAEQPPPAAGRSRNSSRDQERRGDVRRDQEQRANTRRNREQRADTLHQEVPRML